MTTDDSKALHEELVFAIDLTTGEMVRAEVEVKKLADDEREAEPQPLPEPPPRPIRKVAILLDGWDEPLFLPIEPTRNVVFLDALARLLRIAVLAGERIPAVAVEYGEELERRLVFERCLPKWAYSGVDAETASRLPEDVRRVLGPKKSSSA